MSFSCQKSKLSSFYNKPVYYRKIDSLTNKKVSPTRQQWKYIQEAAINKEVASIDRDFINSSTIKIENNNSPIKDVIIYGNAPIQVAISDIQINTLELHNLSGSIRECTIEQVRLNYTHISSYSSVYTTKVDDINGGFKTCLVKNDSISNNKCYIDYNEPIYDITLKNPSLLCLNLMGNKSSEVYFPSLDPNDKELVKYLDIPKSVLFLSLTLIVRRLTLFTDKALRDIAVLEIPIGISIMYERKGKNAMDYYHSATYPNGKEFTKYINGLLKELWIAFYSCD